MRVVGWSRRGVMRSRSALLAALALVAGACSPSATTQGPVASVPAEDASPVTAATITAKNVDFSPRALTLAPGVPIHLVLQNDDPGVPHNLHISGSGQDVVKGDLVTGPATQKLDVGPLQPGGYTFKCDVHPVMAGTITVPAP